MLLLVRMLKDMEDYMQGQFDADTERVVLEGAVDDFHKIVDAWMQQHQIQCQIVRDGTSVTLLVSQAILLKIQDLLFAHGQDTHPRGLYRAFIPSHELAGIADVVTGAYYNEANSRREKAAGRHAVLAALPSDLARLARRKKTSPAS